LPPAEAEVTLGPLFVVLLFVKDAWQQVTDSTAHKK